MILGNSTKQSICEEETGAKASLPEVAITQSLQPAAL